MNYKKEMLQNDVKNNSRTLRLVHMVAERQNRQFFPKNVQLVQRQTTNHPRGMIKT